MKNIFSRLAAFVCVLFTASALSLGVRAYEEGVIPDERLEPLLVDDAGLLSDDEYDALLATLENISAEYGCDVAVVTVDSLGGKSAQDFADDYYDYNGYGSGSDRSGIMLVLSMGDRDWHITTCGYGITAMTDYGREVLSDEFVPYLSGGDYYRAFDIFAEGCENYLRLAADGTPFDRRSDYDNDDYDYGSGFPQWWEIKSYIPIALIIGFVISLIVALCMRGKLKSVRAKQSATDYIVDNSMTLTDSRDIFLYKNVSRMRRSDDNDSGGGGGSSTHVSSSGTTHGGGGGKF